jgi:hypothetical protein
MSWWVILYLVAFGLLAVAGLSNDFYERKPAWFLACAAGANVAVAYFIIAYWNHSLLIPLGKTAPIVFVASMCWEIWQGIDDLRTIIPNTSFAGIAGSVLLYLVVSVPAFIVAGLAAIG